MLSHVAGIWLKIDKYKTNIKYVYKNIIFTPFQRQFITFSSAFYFVKIHYVFPEIQPFYYEDEDKNSPIFAHHVHLFMCSPTFVYTGRSELRIGLLYILRSGWVSGA